MSLSTPEGRAALLGEARHIRAYLGRFSGAVARSAQARGPANLSASAVLPAESKAGPQPREQISHSGGLLEISDEPKNTPLQIFPPISEEELRNLEKEGVTAAAARALSEADATVIMGAGLATNSQGRIGGGSRRGFGGNKSEQKWLNQMRQRDWTHDQIEDTISTGQRFPAQNNINPDNGATRFVNTQTGKSIVIDNKTGDILHVGGAGFKY